MKIHAITFLRDEADVVAHTLRAAAAWCDHIYVVDNGSTDGTWALVQELGQEIEAVVPVRQDERSFSEPLRGTVFREFRSRSRPGDWWCRLDADEIYIDDPCVFLAKIPERYGTVWSAHFNFYFTDEDVRRYEEDPARYAADVPPAERLHYYRNTWSELRLFRDDGRMRWPEDRAWPAPMGRVYPVRIWLRHYQYRSPEQIQRRLDVRAGLMRRAENYNFFHEVRPNWQAAVVDRNATARVADRSLRPTWRERVVPAAKLDYDAGDGRLVPRPDLMPDLPAYNREWMHHSRPGRLLLRLRATPAAPLAKPVLDAAGWARDRLHRRS